MKIISFEGIAGSGKTTISKLVKKSLEQKGLRVLLYRPISRSRLEKVLSPFPGKREKVWVVKLPVVPPKTEVFCYLALLIKDNKDYLSETKYDVVILDRYIDTISSGVFARNNMQGRGLEAPSFYRWIKSVCYKEIRMPDLTFVLALPMSIAQERTLQREGEHYSKNDRILFRGILDFYKFLADREPERFHFTDASRSIDWVLSDCLKAIKKI